jgi:hypothetical protein
MQTMSYLNYEWLLVCGWWIGITGFPGNQQYCYRWSHCATITMGRIDDDRELMSGATITGSKTLTCRELESGTTSCWGDTTTSERM